MIRSALNVDPETAVVHAVSDPIPDVFGGVRLDIRSIDLSLDRAGYTVNPTSCREQTLITAELYGGGANPDDPNAWVPVGQDEPFHATDCKALKFKPKFHARILGGKKQARRTANPKFQAILEARNGDANLRRAAFILPKATILDQGHIDTVCTRVQLAANSCPKESIYGEAKATSPFLDGNLKGPVYLDLLDHQLPDLVVDLRGQVNVRLRGVISSVQGRLKTRVPRVSRRRRQEVHDDDEGRQAGPAGQHAATLRKEAVRQAKPEGTEQPSGEVEAPAAQYPGLQEAQEVAEVSLRYALTRGGGRHHPARRPADRDGARRPGGRGRVMPSRSGGGNRELRGGRLDSVEPRGKHLLLRFGDLVLHSHLGMSGSWQVLRRGARWRKPSSAAWVVLKGETSEAVQFGGPKLRLLVRFSTQRGPDLEPAGPRHPRP